MSLISRFLAIKSLGQSYNTQRGLRSGQSRTRAVFLSSTVLYLVFPAKQSTELQ
jgi:hypothetical protein